jgi:hypothetical protein
VLAISEKHKYEPATEANRLGDTSSPRGPDGAIAQLGERLHGMQEVSGSIPLSSTKFSSDEPPKIYRAKETRHFRGLADVPSERVANFARLQENFAPFGASVSVAPFP